MPKLPDVMDYGARPSLRSNRVDPVYADGVAVAESVAIAADNFARLYGEKKTKDSRLQYALAKNEITALDIAQREGLKDRDDFEQFDEDYSTGFNTGRDEIIGRYARLSPSDQALLQSESELIREKGRVYAGDMARGIEIDKGRAQISQGLDAALEMIQVAPPEQQNEIMLQALETIAAASDADGDTPWFTAEESESMLQGFVSKAATGSLESMDVKQRIAELELSLAHRSARGAIDKDDIASGKGSGSIADFLHKNVATEMLEAAKKENETEDELAAAYAIVDAAELQNPGDPGGIVSATRAAARGGDAGVRARAEQIARQRAEEIRVTRNNERSELMIDIGGRLQQGMYFDQIPPAQLASLSPQQVGTLRSYESMLRNGEQFANSTNWHRPVYNKDGELVVPSYSAWADMTDAQKAEVDLEHPSWYVNFEQGVWKQMQDDQERIRSGKTSASGGNAVQTNDQILTDVWAGEMGLPRTGRSDDEDQMYQMSRSRMVDEIARVQADEYGGKQAPYDVRKKIARQILSEGVYERDYGFRGFIYGRDNDEKTPIAQMDPDDFDRAYVPISEWQGLETYVPIGPNGELVKTTWEDRLKRMASAEFDGLVPETKDLENAYAQTIIGGEPNDVTRRVLEALQGKYEH